MFFRFEIGARARAASRLIGRVRDDIVGALVREKTSTGLTQQQLAEKLDISRAELNRYLTGKDELTLRSISDLAWALNKEVTFEFRDPQVREGQNHPSSTSTAASYTPRRVGDHAEAPRSSGVARTYFARQYQSD